METKRVKHRNRIILVLLVFFLAAVFIFSLFVGRFQINVLNLMQSLGRFSGEQQTDFLKNKQWTVFFYIRLPRIILAAASGAVLSLSGAAYQSIFRNPLVSPDILGVTAGASFGVALGMILEQPLHSIYILAFFSGITAMLATYFIYRSGKRKSVMIMVLAGILVTSLFNALISILKYVADPTEKLPGIVFYLMGGFSRIGWSEVKLSLPFMLVGLIVIFYLRWYLNLLAMGEEEAVSMGVNTGLIRILIITSSTLAVSAAVATTGQVTWVGLVVPHMARYLVGANHRIMLPASAMLGASFLLIMDNLARIITAAEIPISIITALLGAPFFAYLLIGSRESGWN